MNYLFSNSAELKKRQKLHIEMVIVCYKRCFCLNMFYVKHIERSFYGNALYKLLVLLLFLYFVSKKITNFTIKFIIIIF